MKDRLTGLYPPSVCVCVCVRARVCVCVYMVATCME